MIFITLQVNGKKSLPGSPVELTKQKLHEADLGHWGHWVTSHSEKRSGVKHRRSDVFFPCLLKALVGLFTG